MRHILRPDAETIWADRDVRGSLIWYRKVMLDQAPARFRIALAIPADADILRWPEERLWGLHSGLAQEARARFHATRGWEGRVALPLRADPSLLHVKAFLARSLMSPCVLCAWECGVDRAAGRRGICGVGDASHVASAFPHMGEEAPLLGPSAGGSGTVFFGGCPARCVFCQNWETARNADEGEAVTGPRLAAILEGLRWRGCANINLVGGEPTPHLPVILEALAQMGRNVPLVWNSNMYLSPRAMDLLADVVDLWLPDYKYGNDECARLLSRVREYTGVVTRNLRRAYGQGDMIVRHLVLPGHVDCCTKPVLRWIAEHTPEALVNIMDQYRPDYLVSEFPERFPGLNRRPTLEEMQEAYAAAEACGLRWSALSLG